MIHHQLLLKRGNEIGYDGFKKILGTKIHVAVESNGLPISIRTSPANQHNSTKFIDVLENISDFLNDDLIHAIVSAYADKGYDAAYIRNYLRCYGINCCIPYKKNSKTVSQNKNQKYYGKNTISVSTSGMLVSCIMTSPTPNKNALGTKCPSTLDRTFTDAV